jgi:hypothetical protein
MPIILDRRTMITYPFGVFHTSLRSTLCTEYELKSDLSVASVPSHSGQPGGHNLKFDFPKFKYLNEYYIDWSIFH